MVSIQDLPAELLTVIFEYFSDGDKYIRYDNTRYRDFYKLREVNKEWSQLALRPMLLFKRDWRFRCYKKVLPFIKTASHGHLMVAVQTLAPYWNRSHLFSCLRLKQTSFNSSRAGFVSSHREMLNSFSPQAFTVEDFQNYNAWWEREFPKHAELFSDEQEPFLCAVAMGYQSIMDTRLPARSRR